MSDVVATGDYETPQFPCFKEGFRYSYGVKEWTALKLRVALVFFGEPDSLGELKYAVDALRFYAAAKRTGIDRVAHAIGAQVKDLNRGNSDGVGATLCILTLWVMFVQGPLISHCRITDDDGTLMLSVLCVRLFFERSTTVTSSEVRFVDQRGVADEHWEALLNASAPAKGYSVASLLRRIPLLNAKPDACEEIVKAPWITLRRVKLLRTDDVNGHISQNASVFMARRTPPSVKWMVLVLFEQLNVLLETQDVDFLLTTGANKEKLIEAAEGGKEVLHAPLHACLVEMLKRQGIHTREEGGCYLVVTLQEMQAGEHAADIAEKVGINAEMYVSWLN